MAIENNGIEETQREWVQKQMAIIGKWRKGPFNLFGTEVDAEWRSDKKWDRIEDCLGNLSGKDVLDIGCSNGYFCYRLMQLGARSILGIDPVFRTACQFEFLHRLAGSPSQIEFAPLGVNDLAGSTKRYDRILYLGILYHHKNMIEQLELLKSLLNEKGRLIIETIGIPGDDERFFVPPGRYAQMRNVWFLPTKNALRTLLERVGFKSIELISDVWEREFEQRATIHCQGPSYKDFVSSDGLLTIEGHPAPERFIFQVTR